MLGAKLQSAFLSTDLDRMKNLHRYYAERKIAGCIFTYRFRPIEKFTPILCWAQNYRLHLYVQIQTDGKIYTDTMLGAKLQSASLRTDLDWLKNLHRYYAGHKITECIFTHRFRLDEKFTPILCWPQSCRVHFYVQIQFD